MNRVSDRLTQRRHVIMDKHLDELIVRLPCLDGCKKDIQNAFDYLLACFRAGNKVLICGNGGSASDAGHWAGELLKGFESKRPLGSGSGLPEGLLGKLQDAVPVIPLPDFTSLQTAFANDVDAAYSFAQLTWALGKPGDILVGISTSGNSRNVSLAMQAAKARKMTTIGLTGQGGGEVKDLCDCCMCVPETRTCLVQELHLPVYHTLCLMLEDTLF
ncbi:hypothetical protein BVX99_00260 [bacterium F16]|nr:hypothetical protein BVX99_00260 [bacterium F16]